MEAFYLQLLLNARLATLRKVKKTHNGEYDRTHSPEYFYITEEEWSNAASLPPPQTK